MNRFSYFFAALVLTALALAQPAQVAAQSNEPPPLGPIIDLAGMPITTAWNSIDTTFVAGNAATDITLAFRNDPSFTSVDDIFLQDITNPSGNLIVNGGFETGDLTGWTYDNVFGAGAGGVVTNACSAGGPNTGLFLWCDGATQAYDAIDQVVPTTVGDTYLVGFFYAGDGDPVYQRISTNGHIGPGFDTAGNGNDVLLYAQNGLPVRNTPEPSSILMLGLGMAGLGIVRRRQAAKQ